MSSISMVLTHISKLPESAAVTVVQDAMSKGRDRKQIMADLGDCPSVEAQVKTRRCTVEPRSTQPAYENLASSYNKNPYEPELLRPVGTNDIRITAQLLTCRNKKRPDCQLTIRHTMTEREKDDLRAKALGFNCKERGHLSRDCPKKRYHTLSQ
ncbi:hypothetical protein M422DRAFT_277274 [Sphaerobolus stellatus SS14]|uniref:Unplaced genomic scaffold SPHSTscaffold_1311, whole genome shotgun sequence n=1 Tax=Sphaerobolus stellatus (strain SS14) TaxID=990650 RepID=A0A0C9TKG0_SPHS4|nr:hypothetical protein M422DRAFT_277274 [Sphaerobolus stellatus SS14]